MSGLRFNKHKPNTQQCYKSYEYITYNNNIYIEVKPQRVENNGQYLCESSSEQTKETMIVEISSVGCCSNSRNCDRLLGNRRRFQCQFACTKLGIPSKVHRKLEDLQEKGFFLLQRTDRFQQFSAQ